MKGEHVKFALHWSNRFVYGLQIPLACLFCSLNTTGKSFDQYSINYMSMFLVKITLLNLVNRRQNFNANKINLLKTKSNACNSLELIKIKKIKKMEKEI
jgi:hypothetical protein